MELLEAKWIAAQRRPYSIDGPTIEECEMLVQKYFRGTRPGMDWSHLPEEEQAQLLSTWQGFYSQRLTARSGDDVLGRIADEARRSARQAKQVTPLAEAESGFRLGSIQDMEVQLEAMEGDGASIPASTVLAMLKAVQANFRKLALQAIRRGMQIERSQARR